MKSDSKLEDEIKSDACSHLPEYPLEFIDFIRSLFSFDLFFLVYFLSGLSEVHLGELSAALGLTCAVWCLGAVHIYAIYKYTTNEKRRGKLYILALLFPVNPYLSIFNTFFELDHGSLLCRFYDFS